jgi:hypothetical protein
VWKTCGVGIIGGLENIDQGRRKLQKQAEKKSKHRKLSRQINFGHLLPLTVDDLTGKRW